MIRHWFIHGPTGTTFHVANPISWCLTHSRDEAIPWAVLKCLWVQEQAPACPNCEVPQVALRFWWRRRLWVGGLNSTLSRGCFACRRVFVGCFPGDLLEWLVTTLDRGLWPTHHRLARQYDLARDYADLLKRLEEKMVRRA